MSETQGSWAVITEVVVYGVLAVFIGACLGLALVAWIAA